MSETLDAATLPDSFITIDYRKMEVTRYMRVDEYTWDVHVMRGGEWDWEDNVGHGTALAAFKSNDVYVKVNHE